MSTPCCYEGICRKDCPRRGDDCDGNVLIMLEEEREEIEKENN